MIKHLSYTVLLSPKEPMHITGLIPAWWVQYFSQLTHQNTAKEVVFVGLYEKPCKTLLQKSPSTGILAGFSLSGSQGQLKQPSQPSSVSMALGSAPSLSSVTMSRHTQGQASLQSLPCVCRTAPAQSLDSLWLCWVSCWHLQLLHWPACLP